MAKITIASLLLFFSSIVFAQKFKRAQFVMKPNYTVDSLNSQKNKFRKKYGIKLNFTNVKQDSKKKITFYNMQVEGEKRKGSASFDGFMKGYDFGFVIDNSWFSSEAFLIGYIKKK